MLFDATSFYDRDSNIHDQKCFSMTCFHHCKLVKLPHFQRALVSSLQIMNYF